jgi:phage tail-like protein
VITWFLAAFRDRQFEPADMNIVLMNEAGEPLRTWKIAGAIPKKWLVSDLNSGENAVVIETLELTYRYFTIQ